MKLSITSILEKSPFLTLGHACYHKLLWQIISVHFSPLQNRAQKPTDLKVMEQYITSALTGFLFLPSIPTPSFMFFLRKHCSWKWLRLDHLNTNCSAIQYYWIYTKQIHYTRDLRTTAQNTILNTLGIVIGSLIKLFSVTQCLYYPCTCLPPQQDLQRLIYIQYKFYTSNLSQTSLSFSFFASSCFVTSYAAVGSAQELKTLWRAEFYPVWVSLSKTKEE